MRLFLIIVACALGISAAVTLPLAWDGSGILFHILDLQMAVVVLNRSSMFLPHWIVLQASRLTDNLSLLAIGFSTVYALFTFIALAFCWGLVRKSSQARPLFMWAALGIGIVSLPAQASIMAQAVIAVQLFWVLVFVLLVPFKAWSASILILVALFIFFLHPIAILIFVAVTLCALVLGWRIPARRRALWLTAVAFALVTGIATLRFLVLISPYESEGIGAQTFLLHFNSSVRGFPLIGFASVLLGGILIFIQPRLSQVYPRLTRSVPVVALACVAMAGVVLLFWASSPIRWARALDYRTWLFFLTLPFVMFALAEACNPFSQKSHDAVSQAQTSSWSFRRRIIQITAVIFFLVLATQSYLWQSLSNQLRLAITNSQSPCLPFQSLDWAHGTALDDWSITAYSIILQNRAPAHLVLRVPDCAHADFSQGLPIATYAPDDIEYRARDTGWFNFSTLRAALQNSSPP